MSWSLTAKRLRLPLGFVFALLFLAFARPTWTSLGVGAGIASLGLVVRAWASGHIVKNDRLATSGPYAHTRNPLYFGSFLLAAGFAMSAHWSLLLVVVALFALIYAPTMEREKANIRGRFPESYPNYEAHVPAFLPRLSPWRANREGGDQHFSFALYMKHGEWKALLGYLGALVWLALRAGRPA